MFFRLFILGLLLCLTSWPVAPSQAKSSRNLAANQSPSAARSSAKRRPKQRKIRRTSQTLKSSKAKQRQSPPTPVAQGKGTRRRLRSKMSRKTRPRLSRSAQTTDTPRWKLRQQQAVERIQTFQRQVGQPKPIHFDWADYGFPEKIGDFPVERPMIGRVRMWFHVFGAYPPDALVIYDLAHHVILRAVRTPGAALLPGESAFVRQAKAFRRIQNAGPVFRSLQQSLRTLAAVEQKAEQSEKSYWWGWWKQCKPLPHSMRRDCQKQLFPKPARYRKTLWEQHFRKLDPESQKVFRTVKQSPQWNSESWYRIFRDMRRSGLAWKTSYAAFFQKGLNIERRYRKHIHAILRKHDLPIDLAALPFVESMYNPWVRSYVDALGLWQIMPATGKEVGMYISPPRSRQHFMPPIDEREDPLLATHGAARFIKLCRHFFRDSWPLAMTSYNQGPGRVLKIIKQTRTRQLHQMILRASKRSFGPDGRNFYSKFIAAVLLRKQAHKYFPNAHLPDLVFKEIQLSHPIWPDTLMQITRLSQEQLTLYNPMLRHLFQRKHNNVHPVPAYFPLRLPALQLRALQQAVARNQTAAKAKKYMTQSRESLRTIALRLQIPVDVLLRYNAQFGSLPTTACLKPNVLLHHHHSCGPSCHHEHHQFTRHTHFKSLVQVCSGANTQKPSCQRARRRWQYTCQRIQRTRQRIALNQHLQPNTLIQIPAVRRATPPKTRLYTYRVLGNEALTQIACRSCTTVWHLRKLNPHISIERLRAGTELKVPQCDYARRPLFRACAGHHVSPQKRTTSSRRGRRKRS